MVDHTFLYTPAVQKIRELIGDGVLGDIYYYNSIRASFELFQSDSEGVVIEDEVFIQPGHPRAAVDRDVASRISITRSPVKPVEMGELFRRRQSMKCSASVCNASLAGRCGAHISPARYPILIW